MGHTLLIVDDSATTRAFVRRTIQLAGVETDTVLEADDGQAALRLLASEPIDLVVADLHMPVMDGSEMVRRMQENPALRDIPVLVVSADPNTARLQELLLSGVVGYVRKPFTPEVFRVALQKVLGDVHA